MAAGLLFTQACGVETIEVGSRVDDARENGRLPAKADMPLPKPEDGMEGLLIHLFKSGQRNVTEDAVRDALKPLELPDPLRDDLARFLITVDLNTVPPDALPIYAVAYLAEKHHLIDETGPMTEEELARVGLAVQIDDPALLSDVFEDAPGSRLLHCHHATQPDTLMTAYATAVVKELTEKGYRCTSVRIRR